MTHQKWTVLFLLFVSFSVVFVSITGTAHAQSPQTIIPTIALASHPCSLHEFDPDCLVGVTTSVTFKIRFDSAIDADTFTGDDIEPSRSDVGGTLIEFRNQFTYHIYVNTDSTITLRIPAGVVFDTSGNTNSEAQITVRIDHEPPIMTIPEEYLNAYGDYTQGVRINRPYVEPNITCVDKVYEGVTDDGDKIFVHNDYYDAVPNINVTTAFEPEDLPKLFYVRYNCTDAGHRTYSEHLSVMLVKDLSVFNTPPALLKIERSSPHSENTDSQTLTYNVFFSKNVVGIDESDFVLSPHSTGVGNNATHPVTDVSPVTDRAYSVTISAATDGTYNLDLISSGHGITDIMRKPLTSTVPTGADQTYTVSTTVADTTNPRLASIERYSPASQNTDSQTLVYKATFSESVTGVDASDFVLTSGSPGGTSGVSSLSGSGGIYYVTVSSTVDGTYNLDLVSSGHGIKDAADNPLTNTSPTTGTDHTYTVSTVAIDTTNPRLASIERYSPASQNTDSQTLIYKATFSESVTGVTSSDFVLSPGSTGSGSNGNSPVTGVSGSGDAYYITVSPSTDGTYNLDLVSSGHNIEDATGNPLTNRSPTGTDETYTVSTTVTDTANPRLASIERYSPASQNTDSQSLVYKATFSESVTGVTASDFTLSPGSTGGGNNGNSPVTGISGSGDTYYVTVSSTVDGTYNLDLVSSGHSIADDAGNPLTNTAPATGPDQTYNVSITTTDTTNPTLELIERYSPSNATTSSQTLVYRVTFSEDVIGVGADDFALSPGSSGEVGTSSSTTTTTGSETFTKTRSPALAIPDLTTVSDSITIPDSGAATSVSVTVNISHTYIGDLRVVLIAPDGTTKTMHNRSGGSDDDINQTYTPDFDDVLIAGTWKLQIRDNANSDFGTLNSWTLTINYGGTTTTTTTITTTDPVSSISGFGSVYYATITEAQGGTYNLDLVSSGHNIADDAGNSMTNTAPTTGTDQTYTVSTVITDTANPRLASIERYSPASQNTDSQTLVYKATFSESVTGVTASDFVLSPGSTGGINDVSPVTAISGSDDTYYVTVSSTVDGTYNLDLVSSGHSIADTAGNSMINTAPTGADQTYTVSITVTDTTNPRLASIERYSPASQNTDSQTLVYKATFSESVTGVTASDFVLSPDSTGWGSTTVTTTGQFTQTRSPNLTLPNLQTVSDTITVSDSETATSVTVAVNITHAYISDLKVDLVAPDGTTNTLHNRSGGGDDDIFKTYYPSFGSIPISGVWTLRINDNYDADSGVLNSWTLTINYDTITTTTTVNPVTDISGSGDTYYVTVSSTVDGTYNLDLVSSGHNIADDAGNSMTNTAPTTGTDQTYTVSTVITDTANPRLASIERYSPASQNTDSQTLVYKATFSESVTGVTASDFVLSPGSTGGINDVSPVTAISGSDDTYYVTVSSTVDGTYNLDLVSSGHSIADTAGNSMINTAPTGADQTYTVSITVTDTTNPRLASIERYSPASQNTDSQTLVYKATFSESVTGVTASDFVLSPDSTGWGSTTVTTTGQFTQTRSPNLTLPNLQTVSDTITVSDSETATSVTVAVNITHAYISDLKVDLVAPDGTTNTLHNRSGGGDDDIFKTYYPSFGSIPISGVWTLRINDNYDADSGVLNSWTLTINYDTITTTTTVNPVTDISGSGDTYYVTVSSTVDGTYNLDLVSSGHNIADDASNPLTNTVTTGADQTYTVSTVITDTANPRLASIERYSPASQNTDSQTLVYKATFSESVTGVTASDFVLSPGSTGGINDVNPVSGISGSDDTYYVTVSSTVDGTYNLDLVSSGHSIADTAGNSMINTAPTGADQTYTVSITVTDTTNPRLASIERYSPASQNTDSQTLVYKATFSESVTGVTASDFVLSPDSTGWGSTTVTTTGQFTQTRSPNLTLPNLQTVSDTITVSDSETATSVTVAVNITHAYISDLKVDLVAPDGTTNTLHNRSGGGDDDIFKTYYPSFGSIPISGVWTLRINDNYYADSGVLNSWTLTINYDTITTTTTVNPVTDISGSGDTYYVTVSSTVDGTYNLDLVSSGHSIADDAGNPLTNTAPATGPDQTYNVSITTTDTANPTLELIERYSPSSATTSSQTLVYRVTFSEDVIGVGADDFALSPGSSGEVGTSSSTTTTTGSETFTKTRSPALAIPDLTTVSDSITIPDSGAATSVSVTVNISHTYIGDLRVVLIAPDGTTKTMHNRSGGSDDDINQTYTPDFDDVLIAGTWKLQIRDNANSDFGTLNSWTLTINYGGTTTTTTTITTTDPVSSISGFGSVYYATITEAQGGTYNLDLVSSGHNIADDAGNSMTNTAPTTGTDQTYTVSTVITDTANPRLASIERYSPASQNTDSQTLVYKATFSESVTGVTASDFVLSPGSTGGINDVNPVSGISGSDDTYYVTVSSTVDGTYNLDLVSSGHSIADTAGNSMINTAPTGADQTYTVSITVTDTTNPRLASIERYSPASQNTDSQTLVYKATFSESVTGVTASDFVLSPDSTGWGSTTVTTTGQFTQTRSPNLTLPNLQTVSDTITVSDSETATSVTVAVNITHAYISDLKVDLVAPDGTTNTLHNRSGGGDDDIFKTYYPSFGSIPISGVWTLRINDNYDADSGVLNSWTLTINYDTITTTTTVNPVTDISGSGDTYYVTVSSTVDGTYNLDLVSSGHNIADDASNPLTNTATTGADQTYTVSTTVTDTANPRLESFKRYNPASLNTDSQSLVYKATFSESVTGVTASDFVLSPGSTGGVNGVNPVSAISGSGDTYYVTVSSTVDGTYNLDLVSSGHSIADTAGNSMINTAPTGADQTYTVSITVTDTTNPRLASIERYSPASQNTDSQTLVYKATFSESVTGVTASDFVLSPDSTGWGSTTVTTTGQFTQTRSPNLTLPNLQTVSDTITVSDSETATSVTVAVNITHAYISDLKVDLVAPDGTTNTLHNRSGGGDDDIFKTYYPSFGSIPISGVWTLRINDNYYADSGVLNSWTLTINYDTITTTTTVNPVTDISGSGDTYYVTVSSTVDGTYNLDLVSSGHNIADASSNPLTNTATTGADQTYTVSTTVTDTANPRLESFKRYNPASLNTDSQSLVYKATFSESVTGVNTSDFVLSPGSTRGVNGVNPVTAISGSGDTYYVTVSSTVDGTYNLDLVSSGHNIADASSNPLTNTATTGADQTYTVSTTVTDTANPRLESFKRYNPASLNTDSQSLVYKATFSESVTGVNTSDFVLSPGSTRGVNSVNPVTAISGSGDTYYVTVSSTVDGTYNLDLVSSGHNIADASSNPLTNTATTGADQTYTVSTTVTDTANPRLESFKRYNPASLNTDSQSLVYKATFSESVTGVNTSDFVLSPGSTRGVNSVNPVTAISGSGDTYYVTVSSTVDGTYNLDLVSSGHSIADDASNPLTNTATTGADQTYTVSITVTDTTNPRLASIERYSPASQNTDSQTLVYKATFSESVTGVNTSDFVLSPDSTGGGNNGNSPVTGVSGSDSVYYVTVSAAQDGTYNLDLVLSGHGIKDTADNPLTNTVPVTGTDETYTVSTAVTNTNAPTLLSIERYNSLNATTSSRTLIYEVTFSKDVTGVDKADFILSPDSTGNTGNTFDHVIHVSGSGSVYNVIVVALVDGTYNLDLISSGHGIADTDNNSLTYTAPTTGTDETYIYSTAN